MRFFTPSLLTPVMTIPTQTSSADEQVLFRASTADKTIVAYDKGCFWFDLLMTRRSGAFRDFWGHDSPPCMERLSALVCECNATKFRVAERRPAAPVYNGSGPTSPRLKSCTRLVVFEQEMMNTSEDSCSSR